MIKPAVTLAFEDKSNIDHWKLDSTHFLDAKKFSSRSLFEVNSFYYMLDYTAYQRHESEIIERLQGKDKTTHPPIVVTEATDALYQHPCIHNAYDMTSEQASALFTEWLAHARASHQYDYDAD